MGHADLAYNLGYTDYAVDGVSESDNPFREDTGMNAAWLCGWQDAESAPLYMAQEGER